MKGVNAIENLTDPGQDGYTGVNSTFGKDLAAFSLEYFNNDYQAINNNTHVVTVNSSSHPATNSSELFNGNIRYMQTRLTNPTSLAAMPMLNAYKYDQLNRLKESRSYESGLSSNVWNPTTYGNSYYNAFNYDAMGNILTQVRHKRSGTKIEDMNYKYQYLDPTTKTKLQRNRLYHIYEPLSLSDLDATDIDNMGAYDSTVVNINVANNYSYDEEGRLVKDTQEGISKIVWRVDGKVKEIQRPTGTKKWLRFDYDAMGHRIAKHVYNNTGTILERSTYYVLDAQGNQISMYDHEVDSGTALYNLKERNIFGSSRIGSKQDSLNVLTATITQNYTQILGTKYYEFSNHLGNVLTVFSDVKIALDANSNGIVDGYRAPIRNTADYSPFGIQLDGRTLSYAPPAPATQSVTVVYQHKFDDNPSTHPYTTAPNQLNTKLTNVSWTNSQSSWTNFAGFTGKAIATNSATPDTTRLYLNLTVNSGFMLDVKSYSFYHRSSTTGYTNYQLLVNGVLVGSGSIFVSSGSTLQSTGTINVGNAVAGLTGSVTVTLKLFGGSNGNNATFRLDDFTLHGYTQDVQVYAESYRYGFQNQEKDDEIKGAGNSVNYKYRMHDPRVGRFFALDPLESKYPQNSPYAFSENVVINCIELEGLEKINHMVYSKKEKAWKISWTETDNNLKENVNAYHHFNSQGENSYTTVKPWKKSSGNSGTVYFPGNIKPTDENRTMMYHMFESTENAKKSQDQLMLDAKVSNSVAKDATYYGEFEGDYDGGDGGGVYAGLKNMYKAADGLDEIGDNLGYAPTGVTQAGSLAFSGAADILRSIADYNTLDIKSASMNTGIRLVTFGINQKIDKVIGKSKLEETEKYIIKQVSGKATDELKEKSTIKPEKN